MIIRDFSNKELSYLHTNGLGAFVCSGVDGINSRKEHSSYMVTLGNPSNRMNIVGEFLEKITINGHVYTLTGSDYLVTLAVDNYPVFTYEVADVTIVKRFCYKYETNDIYYEYEIVNEKNLSVEFEVVPLYKFGAKGTAEHIPVVYEDNSFKFGKNIIYFNSNFLCDEKSGTVENCSYPLDERDGRDSIDYEIMYHAFFTKIDSASTSTTLFIEYALDDNSFENYDYFAECDNRVDSLIAKSEIKGDFAKRLYVSSLDYLAKRDGLTTIVAGYPFFADWGRDTFISMVGTLIYTKHFEQAKEVCDSFITHLKDGLMPNLFPENGADAMYNTVDASLLFFESVFLYYKESGDRAYVESILPHLKNILDHYSKGTHFNIHMDDDYLLIAGTEKYQLTWMDVRFEDILPTARHGKPVEINALWYNAFCVYNYFVENSEYAEYPAKIKISFNEQFFNGEYLRDFLGEDVEATEQIRSNMSLALSYSFKVADKRFALASMDVIKSNLLTSHGLRSLSNTDKEFKPFCKGDLRSRDLSYHQGTVWPWTTGSFYVAYLEYNDYSVESLDYVAKEMAKYKKLLGTGCLNHIAEIYDGECPDIARGCFAQSWSVSEILRVLIILEKNAIII